MIFKYRFPHWLTSLIPGTVWYGHNANHIYLTFDDGPDPIATPEVLGILKARNVKATFFCLGQNAEDHPSIVDRIRNEGHVIGNHCYSHLNGWLTSRGKYLKSVKECTSALGGGSMYFRPPYGKISWGQYRRMPSELKCVMWSLMSRDFDARQTAQQCLDILDKHTIGGDIVVFHDKKQTVNKLIEVLPKYIDQCRAKGYEFSLI